MILYVWDLHGVLEKDNEIALAEQLNFILERYGFNKKISVAEAKALSGKHYRQIFLELCPGITIKKAEQMGDFAVSTGIQFAKRYVKQREHAFEVLSKINERGDINIVASNAAPDALKAYVEMLGFQGCFTALLPVICEHVKPDSFSIQDYKMQRIQEYIGNKKFDRIKCIGDNEWDIELGLKLGAETYLFNLSQTTKTKAHYVISDLRAVL